VRARVTRIKSNRRERWDVSFQFVGMYKNSARVARIVMTVPTAPPSAVADHVKADEWPCFGRYMVGALGGKNTSMNDSSIITSAPMTGSVSQPNGGSDFCNFFTLRVISDCRSGQDEIEFIRGGLNWSVVLRGASMCVKPVLEKSVQVNVVRLAARDCNAA
jgi:hypothetical protein